MTLLIPEIASHFTRRLLVTAAFSCPLVMATSPVASAAETSDDVIIADFESDDYGAWNVQGTAFGPGPAQGTLPGQMAVEGFQGNGLVNTFYEGDQSTGTLTSPSFEIQRDWIGFLIGGGKNETSLALQLIVDGNVVRSATGPNDQAGGSERLEQDAWDVRELKGKQASIRIIDQATGGWGHINVDQLVQTDQQPPSPVRNAERRLLADARYLNFPIKNGASKKQVTLLVDGQIAVVNTMELAGGEIADEKADWWAPMDVSRWAGKELTIRIDRVAASSNALDAIELMDERKRADNVYREAKRGQFHFSPIRGWNNDPNGMVYYNGEYHLFFQHNPYGWNWGNMHWGHAVSRDLVHWTELGDKLLPDDMGPMFSGGAVVDWNNTSGFGKDGEPPMVLFYTAAGSPTVQGLAFSNDGRNFTKYDGNPILGQVTPGNRDPKVIWHGPTQRWVMVLYVLLDGKHTIHFYTSANLKDWELASVTEGDAPGGRYLYECPEFFELAIDGDPNNKRWVLTAADSSYAIGHFDGKNFTPEQERLPGHQGRGFYAAQTFSDIPKEDGRRIMIGWWQTPTGGMPFNQSMTIPLVLKLVSTDKGPRLTFSPAEELHVLRDRTHTFDAFDLSPNDDNPIDHIRNELIELRLEFTPRDATEVVLNLRDVMIVYDPSLEQLRVDDQTASAPLVDGKQRLTVYVDRTGVEVFASGGRCYVPLPFEMQPENQRLHFETRGGSIQVDSLEVHELKSAWPKD
ncbi:glycoside hydrolase family 32 protein [Roseiconus lacunae]|uniref:glycoside hydrolase family 32 protein n=1 Tax=Roseiconus lacunae TaxID=2605694 RepID=UPI0030921858|nr:glycoside hydrolase family 32 protein [Stieleria sp. HD01]